MPHLRKAPSPSPASDSSPDSSAPRSRLAAKKTCARVGRAARQRLRAGRGIGRRRMGFWSARLATNGQPAFLGRRLFSIGLAGSAGASPGFHLLGPVAFSLVCSLRVLNSLFSFSFSFLFRPFPLLLLCSAYSGAPAPFSAFPRLFLDPPKNARPFGFLPDSAHPRARRFKPRGFLRCGQPRSAAAKRSPSRRPAL